MCHDVAVNGKCMAVLRGILKYLNFKFSWGFGDICFETVETATERLWPQYTISDQISYLWVGEEIVWWSLVANALSNPKWMHSCHTVPLPMPPCSPLPQPHP